MQEALNGMTPISDAKIYYRFLSQSGVTKLKTDPCLRFYKNE